MELSSGPDKPTRLDRCLMKELFWKAFCKSLSSPLQPVDALMRLVERLPSQWGVAVVVIVKDGLTHRSIYAGLRDLSI